MSTADGIKGVIKQAAGRLTGDRRLVAEGKTDQVKAKAGQARQRVSETVEEARARAKAKADEARVKAKVDEAKAKADEAKAKARGAAAKVAQRLSGHH